MLLEQYNKIKLEEQKALSEVFTLTAFFRSLINYPYSNIIMDYLCEISELSKEDLGTRWDNFDVIFGNLDYGKKISALSFSTVIEANTKLLDKVLIENYNNGLILEIASGFSPRGMYFINTYNIDESNYIETDLLEVIELKKDFYNSKKDIKTPLLSDFNAIKDNDWGNILKLVKLIVKSKNIKTVNIVAEGLLIYLNYKKQNIFFNELRNLTKILKEIGVEDVKFFSMEIPSHENFTNWLVSEGFKHEDHLRVMENVDRSILGSLHQTEKDFFHHNSIGNIQKFFYDEDIINKLETGKMEKYKSIDNLNKKIEKFLKQEILYVWVRNIINDV